MAVTSGQGEEEVMSTINITPFTDVLLVLLIIFIILASVTKEPKLPDAHNKRVVLASQIVIIVTDKNEVQIGSRTLAAADIGSELHALAVGTGGRLKTVIIKASPKANFGTILQVMDKAKAENLTGFGLANHVEGQPEGQSS